MPPVSRGLFRIAPSEVISGSAGSEATERTGMTSRPPSIQGKGGDCSPPRCLCSLLNLWEREQARRPTYQLLHVLFLDLFHDHDPNRMLALFDRVASGFPLIESQNVDVGNGLRYPVGIELLDSFQDSFFS